MSVITFIYDTPFIENDMKNFMFQEVNVTF